MENNEICKASQCAKNEYYEVNGKEVSKGEFKKHEAEFNRQASKLCEELNTELLKPCKIPEPLIYGSDLRDEITAIKLENQRLLKKLTSAESQINEWVEEYNFLHDIITDFLTNTGYNPEWVQKEGNLKDIMHDIAYEYNELREPEPEPESEVGCRDPWEELKNLEERVAKMESKHKEDLMDEIPLYARTGYSGRPEAGCKVKPEDYRPGDNSDLTNGFREMLKAAFKYIDPKTMDLLRSDWEKQSKCDSNN